MKCFVSVRANAGNPENGSGSSRMANTTGLRFSTQIMASATPRLRSVLFTRAYCVGISSSKPAGYHSVR